MQKVNGGGTSLGDENSLSSCTNGEEISWVLWKVGEIIVFQSRLFTVKSETGDMVKIRVYVYVQTNYKCLSLRNIHLGACIIPSKTLF